MSRFVEFIRFVVLKAGSQGSVMSRKAVWLAGLVAVGVAVVLGFGVAAGSPVRRGSALAQASMSGMGVARRGSSASDSAAVARARRAMLVRRRWLASPGARAQRVRSRMAFHGLGAVAARGLLVQDFGSVLAGVSVNPAAVMARGGQILQYRGNDSALVSTPGGLRVESSTVPLRVPSGSGGEQPVNLGLAASGGGWSPVRPLASVSIARRLGGGVAVGGGGVRVSLLGDDVAGSVVGGQHVFFGGVGRDMDAVVSPRLSGADLSVVLRSQMAPERFRYHVSLPAGAMLGAAGSGAVVSRDGVVLARIPAPSARDAQGTVVPVRMVISGDDLVVTVAHRGRGFAYPILADPEVVVDIAEDAGAWEFYFTATALYCAGKRPGLSSECEYGEDPLFSHSGPGGGSPLTITVSATLPFSRTRYNKSLEMEEKVIIHSGSALWWWMPNGNEGTSSVEFENVTSAGSAPGGKMMWYLTACSQHVEWASTETAPSSVRFLPSGKNTCNKPKDREEPVEIEVYTQIPENTEPAVNVEGTISVGAVLVTRPVSGEEEEEQRTEKYGETNPGKPNEVRCMLGYPVACATGNQTETQTDLTGGGRGLGLNFVRSYNSQMGYHQEQREEFPSLGRGWTGSYSAHITTEVRCDGLICNEEFVIVHQDNGSTTSFRHAFNGKGEWVPMGDTLVQATLKKSEAGYVYTLPDQTELVFSSSGRLESETERDGNSLQMTYSSTTGDLETVSDSSERKLTFTYNSEGMLESIKDPLGRTVKYAYEFGLLKSVTLPGESTPRWQFKYNSEDELASETDGRGHTVTTTYNVANEVTSQKDWLGRQRKWGYTKTGPGSETTIIEPNSSITVEKFNGAGQPATIVHASGTSLAATTSDEYNSSGELTTATDPNGHTTEYGYDSTGDRTSEKNADGDQTKWTYDGTHDVLTVTNPDNETTTIKRNSHGEPETISRPGPNSTIQTTSYTYDSDGDWSAPAFADTLD